MQGGIKGIGERFGIGVEGKDEFAGRDVETDVVAAGVAPVGFLGSQFNLGKPGFDGNGASILGVVIHHDHFKRRLGRRQEN